MKRLLLIVFAAFALSSGPVLAAPAAQRMSAEEAYNLGQRYLKSGYYTKALEQLNRVRTYYRDDPYALKAELAIADVHFKKNEWDAARLAYEDFMRAHPRYAGLDYVVYRLGLTLVKKSPTVAARDQTWTRQAVNTWLGFSTRFPNSEYSDEVATELEKAQSRLARKELVIARFYARREAWAAVLGRAEGLLRSYPRSPDRAEALQLVGEAYAATDRPDLAQATLEKLRAEAPGSKAEQRLAKRLRAD